MQAGIAARGSWTFTLPSRSIRLSGLDRGARAMETTIEDLPFADRTVRQLFDLYIRPEVAKRQLEGTLPKPYNLISAQIIFRSAGNTLRLNGEVKGEMKVALKSGEGKVPGQEIYMHDIATIEAIDLEEDELDYGHATLVRLNDQWLMVFDFRQFRGTSLQLVDKANDFLKTAGYAFEQQWWGPFADNLFSACELLGKARLLGNMLSPDARTHGTIHSALNRWGKLGNVTGEFVSLFNRLSEERARARYSASPTAAPADGRAGVDIAEAEHQRLSVELQRKVDR